MTAETVIFLIILLVSAVPIIIIGIVQYRSKDPVGFWSGKKLMTVCNLILPVLMIILGRVFKKNPPKKINNVYGYRTSRSKKNQDTWDFAHLYCGKLWWKIGWSMLPLSVISMLPAIGKNDDFIGTLGAVIITVECSLMLITIRFTERALAKKFD